MTRLEDRPDILAKDYRAPAKREPVRFFVAKFGFLSIEVERTVGANFP